MIRSHLEMGLESTVTDARCCRLASLPEELSELPHLTHLDISNNDFITFPWVVFKMKQLRYLNLRGNNIFGEQSQLLRLLFWYEATSVKFNCRKI